VEVKPGEGKEAGRTRRRTIRGGLSPNHFLFRPDDNFDLTPPSPPNLPKWRPELQSTLLNQLASLIAFRPARVNREL
jgi:hypothetical protein